MSNLLQIVPNVADLIASDFVLPSKTEDYGHFPQNGLELGASVSELGASIGFTVASVTEFLGGETPAPEVGAMILIAKAVDLAGGIAGFIIGMSLSL